MHSLEVTAGLLVLGLSNGRLGVISLEDGSLVCQMKARDPDNPEATPGHVSQICHVTRDTRDHVTVMTSGELLCSWSIDQTRPELVYCTRQGVSPSPCSTSLMIIPLQDRHPRVPN